MAPAPPPAIGGGIDLTDEDKICLSPQELTELINKIISSCSCPDHSSALSALSSAITKIESISKKAEEVSERQYYSLSKQDVSELIRNFKEGAEILKEFLTSDIIKLEEFMLKDEERDRENAIKYYDVIAVIDEINDIERKLDEINDDPDALEGLVEAVKSIREKGKEDPIARFLRRLPKLMIRVIVSMVTGVGSPLEILEEVTHLVKDVNDLIRESLALKI